MMFRRPFQNCLLFEVDPIDVDERLDGVEEESLVDVC